MPAARSRNRFPSTSSMTEPAARATARPERLEIAWSPGARLRPASATRARLRGPGTSVAILGAFNSSFSSRRALSRAGVFINGCGALRSASAVINVSRQNESGARRQRKRSPARAERRPQGMTLYMDDEGAYLWYDPRVDPRHGPASLGPAH